MPIIDAHVHVLDNYAPMAPFEDSGRHDRLLAHMDENGVEKAVMVPVVADFSPANNEECAQLARDFPDRLATLTNVELDQPGAPEHIVRAREEFGAVGISWYGDIALLREPSSDPVWQALAAHGLVCHLHVRPPGYGVLLELARQHEEVRLVINHQGLPGDLDPSDATHGGLLEAAPPPNLFVKASGFYHSTDESWDFRCPRALGFFSNLLKGLGPERLLWGSDWPPTSKNLTYRQALEIVRTFAVDLDDQSRSQVLGENAARLYNI